MMAFFRIAANRKVAAEPNIENVASLAGLPNEMLLAIFKDLDITNVLSLANVSRRFNQLARDTLIKQLHESSARLHLHFVQEHKWRHTVEMAFSHVDPSTGNLVFRQDPDNIKVMRMYHSAILRNPMLWKVSMTYNRNGAQETVGYPQSLSSLRKVRFEDNFLQSASNMSIKRRGTIHNEHTVFRKGDGTTHLPVDYKLTYEVNNTPDGVQRMRSGERYVNTLEFSCPLSFFYPHEAKAHKIFMSLVTNYRRNAQRTATLKKNRPKQSPEDKQKQRVVAALASSSTHQATGTAGFVL